MSNATSFYASRALCLLALGILLITLASIAHREAKKGKSICATAAAIMYIAGAIAIFGAIIGIVTVALLIMF